MTSTSTQYAGFGSRFVAALIDGIVAGTIAGIVAGFFVSSDYAARGVTSFLEIVYSIYFIATYGQTVGKMVMKIKVVKEDGQKLTMQDAIVREFSKILSFVALFLGFLWVLWDPKKQSWHDKIAKTIVVKA